MNKREKVEGKPFPVLKTDEEAEAWLESVDLSEYDFSQFKPAQFVLKKKDARVNMRLPESQLRAVKAAASVEGIPYQRFIRKAIDEALDKSFRASYQPKKEASKPKTKKAS